MTNSVQLSKGPQVYKSNVGAEGLNLRVEDIILEGDLGDNFEHEMEEQDLTFSKFSKDDDLIYIELQPQDVYRVPLMWMMPDSHVDMYLEEVKLEDQKEDMENEDTFKQKKQKIPLISNITQRFSKTALDK